MADWQITALIVLGGAAIGGSLVNISMKMDKIEQHFADIVQALRDRPPNSN